MVVDPLASDRVTKSILLLIHLTLLEGVFCWVNEYKCSLRKCSTQDMKYNSILQKLAVIELRAIYVAIQRLQSFWGCVGVTLRVNYRVIF